MATAEQNKSDRVNIVYSSRVGDSVQDVELPFRVLVVGDFTQDEKSEMFDRQEAIDISSPSLEPLFVALKPQVNLKVKNCLSEEGGDLRLKYRLTSMADFDPHNVLENIPPLAAVKKLIIDLYDVDEFPEKYADEKESIALTILQAEGIDIGDMKNNRDKVNWLISSLESRLSQQLDEIIHDDAFNEMETAWRSLLFLVERTDFSENCELSVLNISKQGLREDFEDSPEIFQSGFYQVVYTSEFGQFGGRPYGALIGNYEFGPKAQDVKLLQRIASVAAISHTPFIASASPRFFQVEDYAGFSKLRDLTSILNQPAYAKWHSFCQSPDARYVGLTLPGFLLRPSYEVSIDGFEYQEHVRDASRQMLWGNAAFAFATRLVSSFARYRWCLNITGDEDGLVEGLSVSRDNINTLHTGKIPTQLILTDRRETELVSQGFIPLSVHKGDDTAAFYSAYSVHRFDESGSDKEQAFRNRLGAQIPYLLIVCRISHYIKIMQREHIGSWKNRRDIDHELNAWLRKYVSDMDNPAPGVRCRRPLRYAEIKVREVDGKSDWFLTKINITPHIKHMGHLFTLSETSKLEKT